MNVRRRRLPQPSTIYLSRQRVFDIAVTLLLALPALVLGALLAVVVFLDSPGPVLFRSRRVGRGGRTFSMLKFRTMRDGASGPSVSARRDERYTPVGRWLAITRVDELPQLWNVVRGQMRLVGPRPELEQYVREQWESYERILSVPPGLTGPTQLAFADEGAVLASSEDREELYRIEILPAKVRLDLQYVESHRLSSDLLLIAKTCALPLVKLVYRLAGRLGAGPRQRAAVVRALAVALLLAATVGLFTFEAGSPL